jgi:WD40 repeat protein
MVTFLSTSDYSQTNEVELPTKEWTTYLKFSPSGNQLAAVRFNCHVSILDVNEFEVINNFERGDSGVCQNLGLAYSPDGTYLAGVEMSIDWEDHIRVWNMNEMDSHVDLPVPNRGNDVAFSPDGTMLAAGIHTNNSTAEGVNSVMIWRVPEFELLYQIDLDSNPNETDNITTLRFSNDSSRLAIGRWNGLVEMWQVIP